MASRARLRVSPSSVALCPEEGGTHGAGDLQRQKWEKRLREMFYTGDERLCAVTDTWGDKGFMGKTARDATSPNLRWANCSLLSARAWVQPRKG